MAKATTATVVDFFGTRRRIAAIDYAFVAMLAWGLRAITLRYGEIAGPIVRAALRID